MLLYYILQNDAHFWVRSQNREKWRLASSCLSACLSFRPFARNNSAPTRRIFMKFYIWWFSKICREGSRFVKNMTRITGTFYENLCTFIIISCWILFRMRSVSAEVVVKIKTYISCFGKLYVVKHSCVTWGVFNDYIMDNYMFRHVLAIFRLS